MTRHSWLRFGFSDMVAVVFIAIGVTVMAVAVIEPSFHWWKRVSAFVTGIAAVGVGVARIRNGTESNAVENEPDRDRLHLPEPPGVEVQYPAFYDDADDEVEEDLPLSPEQPHDRSKDTNRIETDAFSNPESARLHGERWPDEPSTARQCDDGQQCGGCAFFAPLNLDWGICCNPRSRHLHETVFEHFTCPAIVNESWDRHSFRE